MNQNQFQKLVLGNCQTYDLLFKLKLRTELIRFETIKSSTSNKNIESLSSLLEKLKIEKIGEKLEAEDIDLESLIMLKEDDLKVSLDFSPIWILKSS